MLQFKNFYEILSKKLYFSKVIRVKQHVVIAVHSFRKCLMDQTTIFLCIEVFSNMFQLLFYFVGIYLQ